MSIASDIVNGEICGACNIPFVEENGYPCLCRGCWEEKHPKRSFEIMWMDEEGFQPAAEELFTDKGAPSCIKTFQ